MFVIADEQHLESVPDISALVLVVSPLLPASSVTCAVSQEGTLLLDPDGLEEQSARLVVSMAFAHHYAAQGVGHEATGDGAAGSKHGDAHTSGPNASKGSIRVDQGALMCHTWPCSNPNTVGSPGIQAETLLDCFDCCALGCGKVTEFLRSALTKALAT
ncbi:hypothetical protein DUNSADRAFT_2669 [Dunaliella salina]|uniref:Encoded protein n=1 Tax=Dunaliella salina TaxID=3046 RepID=A0ABQ7H876_DUNSA|nr:hypothetical protein DUNSADRAFT_2669 [Dunaliella salina]|eukprot:KAF5843056.1 hypothetical protein DUNSADRAFT_2669 [Dunaliella salina]